jgi:hypothetical protein
MTENAAEYTRRLYASTREWYTISETKAQLLLTVNGAFVTIFFGILFGKVGNLHAWAARFGPEAWVFLGVAVVALASAGRRAAAGRRPGQAVRGGGGVTAPAWPRFVPAPGRRVSR